MKRESPNRRQPPRSRRRLPLLMGGGLLLIGMAIVVRIYFVPPERPSAVAEAAAKASPEVAELLYEVDAVAQELLLLYPDSVDAIDVMAMLHNRFGKQEEALALWHRCLEQDPGFHRAHFHIGLVAHDRGDNAEASQHFRQALEIDSSQSSYPVHLAKSLTNEGKLDEAADVLQADLARRPDSVATLAVLGDTHLQLSQHAEARRCYERVVQLAPSVTSAYYGLGMACSKLGEPDEAKQHLDRFRELKAVDEQAHRDELKTDDLGLVRVREGVAEILTWAAKAYLAQGNPQPAEALLIRSIVLDGQAIESSRVLAWLFEQQTRMDEAVRVLTDQVDRTPKKVLAQLSLAQLHGRLGQFDQATGVLSQAIELAPNEAGLHSAMAELHLQSAQKPAKARDAAQRAVELSPTARHYFLLAMACRMVGDQAAAETAIDRAVALDPSQNDYLQLRIAIRNSPASR